MKFKFSGFLFLFILSLSSCCIVDNFHHLDGNRAYRSGQMSATALEKVIRKHGIRTVINLRGPAPKKEWYQEEVKVCKKLQVEHYSVRFSARSLPYQKKLIQLMDLYRTAPYPILIHCQGGADRTSLASVLYRMVEKEEPLDLALRQMNFPTYCHIPLFSTAAMDWFFELYKKDGQDKDIRKWIQKQYDRQKYYPDK